MTSDIKILRVRLTAEEAQGDRGLEIIQQLKPNWPKDKIGKKKLSGGFINLMQKFFNEDDPTDAVVFRLYGDQFSDKYFSRESELLVMQLAHHMGCFPKVLGFFTNGVAYEYAQGRPMTERDFEDAETIRATARAVCGFHNADMDACQVVDRNGQKSKFDTNIFDLYQQLKEKFSDMQDANPYPDKKKMLDDNNITMARMHGEVDEVEKFLEDLELPKSVCHYDFHQGNCLYNEETNGVTVVDFESTRMGYEAYDIGGVFVETSWRGQVPGFYPSGQPPKFTEEVKRLWAKEYVTSKCELHGRARSDVTEDMVEKMYLEHELVAALYHLFWLANFLPILHTPKASPLHMSFIKCEYDLYMKAKAQWPELKARYLAVKEMIQ